MPHQSSGPILGKYNQWLRTAAVVVVFAIGLYGAWQRQQEQAKAARPSAPRVEQSRREVPKAEPDERQQDHKESSVAADNPQANARTTITQQTIRDEDGEVVFRGDVNVRPTLERISRDERLRFSHDGIVFQNRERRLPQKPAGYYHEYVHPTPRLSGPGPQRIILGQEGETYYTPDHYRTFRRLDE